MPRATRSEAEIGRQILEGINREIREKKQRRALEDGVELLHSVGKVLGLFTAIILVYCAFTLPR